MKTWINPKTESPDEGQKVLFKTVFLHTKKIRYGRYCDKTFLELEAGGFIHDENDVWGWLPFEDCDKRE